MKKILFFFIFIIIVSSAIFSALLFIPKNNTQAISFKINKGYGLSAIAKQLAKNDQIFSSTVFQTAAYFSRLGQKIHIGTYRIPAHISTWNLIQLLQQRPEITHVRIIEGMKFAQMRTIINSNPNLSHDTLNLSDEELLHKIDPNTPYTNPEGLFFPDSYEADQGSSDLYIYQKAYRTMKKQVEQIWQHRQTNLPYKNSYELLTMASIVEKETAHPDDRMHVAAVFRNRLDKGMRLQTDPTVIYGMGESYKGNIHRSDLEKDTPYNTYTRTGLPPTPICLPGKAALQAAANPSNEQYLYFVAKMDGSGKSQFSYTLKEHNAAVQHYILKK